MERPARRYPDYLAPSPDPGAELHVLLHSLWTKAQDSPAYDKSEWLRLETLLSRLGVSV